ncbi:GIY-YIG nuclease family protein [Streptomyces sp. NPDC047737]|uniref:GIY-YIG nuclease family protein n=1 Tax=Streptomyces sp. NPDC047737 TaxID=3155740 RepID=UPI0033F5EDA4
MTSTPALQAPRNVRSRFHSKSDIIIERFVGLLAWGAQASAAAVYATVTFTAPAWRTLPTFAFALLGFAAVLLVFLWGLSLYEEQKSFYDRVKTSLFRRSGLLGHASLLLLASVASISLPNPQRVGIWVVLGFCALMPAIVWEAWMRLQYLPPEDQAVIDAISRREAQTRAAVHDASEKEHRLNRLGAIVASLGYELTDRPSASPPKPEVQVQAWEIPPRKHSPLVYFIRNGNRLKIGTTGELKRRIRTLALRAENVVLLVDGGQEMERVFHRQFSDLRIGNTEWFAYEGALVDFITSQNKSRKDQDQ